jgi:hypothetical protein
MIIVEDPDQDQGLDQVLMKGIDAEDVGANHQAIKNKNEEAEIKKIRTENILKMIKRRRSIKNINTDLLQILIHDRPI